MPKREGGAAGTMPLSRWEGMDQEHRLGVGVWTGHPGMRWEGR